MWFFVAISFLLVTIVVVVLAHVGRSMIADFFARLLGLPKAQHEPRLRQIERPHGTQFNEPFFLCAHLRVPSERSEYKLFSDPASSFLSATVETRYGTYYAYTSNPSSAHAVTVYYYQQPRGGFSEFLRKPFMTLVAKDAPLLFGVLSGGSHPECEILLDRTVKLHAP